jgi:hypothetical protein
MDHVTAREQLLGSRVRLSSPWPDPTLRTPCGVLMEDERGRVFVQWDSGDEPEETVGAQLITLDVL